MRNWQWEKSHDASKRPVRQLPAGDKPFAGMTIVLSGRMSRPQVCTALTPLPSLLKSWESTVFISAKCRAVDILVPLNTTIFHYC